MLGAAAAHSCWPTRRLTPSASASGQAGGTHPSTAGESSAAKNASLSQATREKLSAVHLGRHKDGSWRSKARSLIPRCSVPSSRLRTTDCRVDACASESEARAGRPRKPAASASPAYPCARAEGAGARCAPVLQALAHATHSSPQSKATLVEARQAGLGEKQRLPLLAPAAPAKMSAEEVEEFRSDLRHYRNIHASLKARPTNSALNASHTPCRRTGATHSWRSTAGGPTSTT